MRGPTGKLEAGEIEREDASARLVLHFPFANCHFSTVIFMISSRQQRDE